MSKWDTDKEVKKNKRKNENDYYYIVSYLTNTETKIKVTSWIPK